MWIALLTPVLIALGIASLVLAAAIVFAETGLLCGFFLPGDGLLFTMGVLTAAGVLPVSIVVVMVVLTLAAVAGDFSGYAVGRRYGPRLFCRPGSRVFNPSHLAKAEIFMAKHGPTAVILARFMPWARTFVPVVAGASAVPRSTFARLNVIGAVAWVWGVTMIGYSAGHLELIASHPRTANLLIGVVTLLPVLLVRWVRKRRARGDAAAVLAVVETVAVPATAVGALV